MAWLNYHAMRFIMLHVAIFSFDSVDWKCDVQELPVLGRTLVVGRRTNVLLGNDSLLYLPEIVTQTARQRGKLFIQDAEDYFFIAFNNFPWHLVADVVVGRPAYDNYLVGLAIQQNVAVVDASGTLLAVHQTDKDGNMAGHNHVDNTFNRIRIGPKFNYRTGLTSSAQYVTRFVVDEVSNRTKVTVQRRPRAHVSVVSHSQLLSTNASTQPIKRRPTDGKPKSLTNYSSNWTL